MINVEIDGYYCTTCQQWHPHIFWHEKFDEMLRNRKERFEEEKKKRPLLFQGAEFIDSLPAHYLEENMTQEPCVMCQEKPFFINMRTKHFVCSEKCRYADDEGGNINE